MHTLAVPDANPAELKRPETAARQLLDAIAEALHGQVTPAGLETIAVESEVM